MEKREKSVEAVIRLLTYEPLIISTGEYEMLEREVRGRILAGDPGLSDRICLRLLEEHRPRYHEAKHINEKRGI